MNKTVLWDIAKIATGSIVTLLIFVIKEWRSRDIPRQVICMVAHRASMLKIPPEQRKDISVSHKGKAVTNLTILDFKVINRSNQTISKPRIRANLSETSKILAVDHSVKPNTGDDYTVLSTWQDNELIIDLPYINTHRHHRHEISVTLLCDGDVLNVSFAGSGEGWSVKQIIPRDPRSQRKSLLKEGICACIVMLILSSLLAYYNPRLSIDPNLLDTDEYFYHSLLYLGYTTLGSAYCASLLIRLVKMNKSSYLLSGYVAPKSADRRGQ